MRLRKLIFSTCIIIALTLFANGIIVLVYLNDGQLPGYGAGRFLSDRLHFEGSISETGPVNLLVLGLDEEGIRTDVILLFNYDSKTSKLNILSIARDTRVSEDGRHLKINALFYMGKEALVARKIQEITGLSADYYMTFDFKGFRKIIDTLGGVTFDVPFNMDYDDPDQNLHIHLDKGTQLLNGYKAEQLVRYRKGNRQGQGYIDGDIGRIRMQQEFIKALIKQKVRLKYLAKVNDIFSILKEYVSTNIDITDLKQYYKSISNIRLEQTRTYTLPGDTAIKGNAWYFIYDKDSTDKLINDSFYK